MICIGSEFEVKEDVVIGRPTEFMFVVMVLGKRCNESFDTWAKALRFAKKQEPNLSFKNANNEIPEMEIQGYAVIEETGEGFGPFLTEKEAQTWEADNLTPGYGKSRVVPLYRPRHVRTGVQ